MHTSGAVRQLDPEQRGAGVRHRLQVLDCAGGEGEAATNLYRCHNVPTVTGMPGCMRTSCLGRGCHERAWKAVEGGRSHLLLEARVDTAEGRGHVREVDGGGHANGGQLQRTRLGEAKVREVVVAVPRELHNV